METVIEGLKLVTDEHRSDQAVMPIRWCLTMPAARAIANATAIKSQIWHMVLIAQTDAEGQEIIGGRKLINLSDLMTYVQFRKPGVNTLHAWVLETTCKTTRYGGNYDSLSWSRNFLRRVGHRYCYALFDVIGRPIKTGAGERWPEVGGVIRAYGTLSVTVDSKFFAKPPPPWLNTWVNGACEGEPVDECQFRKRLIPAFTVQPPAVLFIYVWRLLILAYLILFGVTRGIEWTNFFKWYRRGYDFHGNLDPDWQMKTRSIILTDKQGRDRHWVFVLYTPILLLVWLLLAAACFWVWNDFAPEHPYFIWRSSILVALLVPLATWLLITISTLFVIAIKESIALGSRIWRGAMGRWQKFRPEKPAPVSVKIPVPVTVPITPSEPAADVLNRRRMEALSGLKPLMCQRGPVVADIRSLPRVPLRLRFAELKARICKPFAQQ